MKFARTAKWSCRSTRSPRIDTAYQLARDALTVHRAINVIFAINDSTALGAIHACRDLQLDPCQIMVVTFGLEGNTLIEELMADRYCKAGLAMFPEIVSLACIEAAIMAYNREAAARQAGNAARGADQRHAARILYARG